jgi:protein Xni
LASIGRAVANSTRNAASLRPFSSRSSVGRKSEALAGRSKIGSKKAAHLLRAYGTLDGVMAGAGILQDALGQKLRREKAQAYLSPELVRLKTDVTLGVTWKMLAFTADADR